MDEDNHYPALIYYVDPDLYTQIENKKEKILHYTNTEVLKGEGATFDFKYNSTRKAIGLFVKKGSVEKLVLQESDVEEKLRGVFQNVHKTVLIEIDSIRIREEVWR